MAEYLKPTSDGYKALTPSAGPDHYVLVDDAENDTHDSGATFVNSLVTSGSYDEYGLENLVATEGTFSLQIRAAVYNAIESNGAVKLGVKIGSTIYYASEHVVATTFTWYYDTWTNNPATSAPWTVSEINDVVAVLWMKSINGKTGTGCTCLYAVVETEIAESVYSKVMGVARASISKVMGAARAAISKIDGKS